MITKEIVIKFTITGDTAEDVAADREALYHEFDAIESGYDDITWYEQDN